MAGIAFARRTIKHIIPVIRTSTISATRRFSTILLPSTRTPWLRVPTDTTDFGFVGFGNFYNIVDKRLVKLEIIEPLFMERDLLSCVGSSRGSLAFVCQSGELYLGHPYSGKGHEYKEFGGCCFGCSSTLFYINVGAKYGPFETLLCYPRHHLQNPTPNNYHDFYVSDYHDWVWYGDVFHKDDPPIAYFKKTNTVYKLSCNGIEHGPWVVELWDIPDYSINVTSRINVVFDSNYEIETFERELRERCHQDRYLVLTGDEGGRGDPVLYLVVRYHNRELGVSQTRAVDVFRFDLVAGKMIYTKQLDDHAFFIGQGSDSFSIPVEQCGPGELKPDSVYIADDLRVFDLKDGSITPILDTGDLSMTRFQSLWIPPPTPEQIEKGKEWTKRNFRQ